MHGRSGPTRPRTSRAAFPEQERDRLGDVVGLADAPERVQVDGGLQGALVLGDSPGYRRDHEAMKGSLSSVHPYHDDPLQGIHSAPAPLPRYAFAHHPRATMPDAEANNPHAFRDSSTHRHGASSAIRIEKTYLDVVAPDGKTCIAYAMDLRWGPLRLAAASTLVAADAHGCERSEPPRSRTRVGVRPLERLPAGLAFRSDALGVCGLWRGCDEPGLELALGTPGGPSVRWVCLAPTTQAEVVCDGVTIAGEGYAERIVMECAPWDLPIDTLRWGRFIAGPRSVVWIAWCRAHEPAPTVSMLLVDGAPVEPLDIGDSSIRWKGGSLALEAGRVLRDAPFASGPIASIASLVPGLPPGYLHSRERKAVARARLLPCDGSQAPDAEGWAIHETVCFTRPVA